MQKMTPEEYRAFMLDTVRTGKIATVREDGRPHVVPIWFDLDGDDLIFTTWHTSIKAYNLGRDGRVSICVDDERPPFAFVLIDGTASMTTYEDNPEVFLRWATRIGGRYMGQDKAEAFGKRNAVPGELLVRVKPSKINAQKGISD